MTQLDDSLEKQIAAANAAATIAADARVSLRRRTQPGDPERAEAIERALSNLAAAMTPLRSAIGRLVWEPLPDALEQRLRDASARCQYERRQLRKMQKRDAAAPRD